MDIQLVNVSKGSDDIELRQQIYITMPFDVYNDLMGYTQHYTEEVSGCGMIEVLEHKSKTDEQKISREFRVTELILPEEQDNGNASTEIEENVIHNVMTKLIADNKDVSKLKLHWHSHAGMSVFHSGTDEENYMTLNNKDFLVSLVVNRSYEVLGRVDLYSPLHICLKDLPVYLLVNTDNKVSNDAKSSMTKLDKYIEANKYKYTPQQYNIPSLWKGDNEDDNIELKRIKELSVLRTKFGIDEITADFYEQCNNTDCGKCPDKEICEEYNRELCIIDNKLYNITDGGRDDY